MVSLNFTYFQLLLTGVQLKSLYTGDFFFDLVKIQSEGGGCHLHFKHSIAPKVRHLASGRVDSN